MLAIEEQVIGSGVDVLETSETLEPPKWLDRILLEQSLQKCFDNNQLNIINFKVKPATAKGENYASVIYRVNVVYSDSEEIAATSKNFEVKTLSVIVKTSLQGDFAFDTLSAMNVYEKEIEFYDKIAPLIRKTLHDASISEQLLAETYGVNTTNNAMLFEDLLVKGYRLVPIKQGFNMEEAQLIVSKTATFHAVCAVLQEQNPNIFDNFEHGFLTRSGSGALNNMYLTQLDAIIELTNTWPDFEYYTAKLRRFRGNFIEKGSQAFDVDPNHFNTLIHGDLWTNNILLKYNSATDQVENAVFLDFQFSCWTSWAIDLQYILNTSLCETLRTHHLDDLIEHYHKKLSTMLKRLNYGKHVPTLRELQSQFREKSFYGFSSSCITQPIQLNEHTENADFEALVLGDERSMEFKRLIYQAPIVQANLRKLIPFYDRLGVFD